MPVEEGGDCRLIVKHDLRNIDHQNPGKDSALRPHCQTYKLIKPADITHYMNVAETAKNENEAHDANELSAQITDSDLTGTADRATSTRHDFQNNGECRYF